MEAGASDAVAVQMGVQKMDTETAIKRILHDDDMAAENWSLIATTEAPQRPVVTEDNTGDAGLETEYLNAVFARNGFYGIPRRTEDIGEGGEPRVRHQTEFLRYCTSVVGTRDHT